MTSNDGMHPGWLEREADDGRYYRSLLARIDGGETTLPLDRVAERFAWWRATPHTAAWARRYGGRHDRVEHFFSQSLEALASLEAATAQAHADETERRAQKERATRRFLLVSSSIAAVALLLLVVTVFLLLRAERTTHVSLVSQSNSLSRDAESEADRGDYADAALLALAALPLDLAHPDRPFTWPAYGALTDALANIRETHTYRVGDSYPRFHLGADQKHFVAWFGDGTISIWQLGEHGPIRVFKSDANLNDVAISRDGRFIASGSQDGTIRVWSTTSARTTHMLRERGPVTAVAFRYDSDWLLASMESTTSLYDLKTDRKMRTVPGVALQKLGPDKQVDAVTLYRKTILLFQSSGTVTLWNSSFSKKLRVWEASFPVTNATLSEDGKRAAIAYGDNSATLFDCGTGKQIARFADTGGPINGFNFSADGTTIAIGHRDSVHVWNALNGTALSNITLRVDNETYGLSGDGRELAVSSTHGSIEVWSTSTGRRLLVLAGHESYVAGTEFSRDESRLLTASDDGTIREWDVAKRVPKTLRVLVSPGAVLSNIAVSRDGAYFVTADRSVVGVYEARSGATLRTLRNLTSRAGATTFVAFTANGRSVAIASSVRPGSVIWNWRTNVITRRIPAADPMRFIEFSPNGERVVSTANGTDRVRDARTGRIRLVMQAPGKHVIAVHFSPDGARILSVTRDGAIRVYDSHSGRTLLTFRARSSDMRDGVFSPDGRLIASASRDRIVRVWDAYTGALVTTRRCVGEVNSVVFSSDSQRLLIASVDSLRIWDIATGRTVMIFRGFEGYVEYAAFVGSDTSIATVGTDHTLRLWALPQLPVCQAAIDEARKIIPHEMSSTLADTEYITSRERPSLLSNLSPQQPCR